jgi:4-aminobutyrate aminotransferase-like enzyme
MASFEFEFSGPTDVPQVATDHRRIATQIPHPESAEIAARLHAVEARAMHGQMPVVWDRAHDYQVFDPWGNCWIDFTSTIFVANAGHANERIVAAIRSMLDKPLLHTYNYMHPARADYLEYLVAAAPAQFEKAFLLSAGTEATECAIKLMRMDGQVKKKRRGIILGFEGNWHGRTMGAQLVSHHPDQKEWIGHDDPDVFHLPFPYPWIDEAIDDPAGFFETSIDALIAREGIDPGRDICGIMLETFQGWGAVFYPDDFVASVCDFEKYHGILVAFDEMQAGFGRTGELFGYMHYGVEPDILCCGKGASSSLPLSIVLGSREVMDLPAVGSMSSTHSANPLACVAGHANLQALLEDGLLERSRGLGKRLHQGLQEIQAGYPQMIRHVLGRGMIAGVILEDEDGPRSDVASRVCELAMRRGLLLVHTGRESIKIGPPLSIPEAALDEGLAVLDECIGDALAEQND